MNREVCKQCFLKRFPTYGRADRFDLLWDHGDLICDFHGLKIGRPVNLDKLDAWESCPFKMEHVIMGGQ